MVGPQIHFPFVHCTPNRVISLREMKEGKCVRSFTFMKVEFQPGEGGDGVSGQLGGWPLTHTGLSLHSAGTGKESFLACEVGWGRG